jgi:hypothetical protein
LAYGTAVGYVDDIGVVTFGDIEAHEAYLRMVLGAMEASKLRIQPAKCEFFRTHGAFLGHVLSEEGVSQQPSKLEAIKNWPELTDLKAVRAFVSLCSYYRKFIQNFAGLAQPLTDLMRKDAFKVPFSDEVLESIAALKSALTSAPVLSYFDSQKATELFVDASKFSIGAVLQQIITSPMRARTVFVSAATGCQSGVQPTLLCTGSKSCIFSRAAQRRQVPMNVKSTVFTAA